MKIHCNECGNEKDFTLRKEVEIGFDYEKGEWDKTKIVTSGGIIVCNECGEEADITIEE